MINFYTVFSSSYGKRIIIKKKKGGGVVKKIEMRCFLKDSHALCGISRWISVGTPGVHQSISKVPKFGKRRRQSKTLPALSTTNVSEEDAEVYCKGKCGFIEKPVFFPRWSEFYSDLRRIYLSWRLYPIANGGTDLRIFDRHENGNELLHTFRGSNSSTSSPIADLFEACGSIINGSLNEESIYFKNNDLVEVLRITPQKMNSFSDHKEFKNNVTVLPQSRCTSVALNITHVNVSNSVVSPLVTNISFQAFCFAFLNSIPDFLKRSDAGIKNIDFVSQEQMRHFRFAWCYLRREAWMTPVELGELDLLLPSK